MATVNKQSLREEFDALKARFESLCAEGKMSADSRALVDALLAVRGVDNGKAHAQEQHQSSLPASRSPHDETALQGRTMSAAPTPAPARASNVRDCGEDLSDAACLGHATHPHRYRVRESGAPRRRTNQGVPHRDAGTLPRPDARPAHGHGIGLHSLSCPNQLQRLRAPNSSHRHHPDTVGHDPFSELTFIVDAHDYAWANRMKRLLLNACHHVSKRDDKTLTASQYNALQKR